jgi:hypothetical protein
MGIVLFFCANISGAESPLRFLQATQWIAQITRTVSDSGSSVQENCDWTWDLATQVSVQLRLTKFPGGESVPVWEAVETQYYTGTGHENFSEVCPDGATMIAKGQPASEKPPPILGLNVDPDAGTYTLSFGTFSVPWQGTINYGGAFEMPQADKVLFWSGDASGEIERPLPDTGMALQGEASYPLNQPPLVNVSSGATFPYVLGLGGGNIQISWNIRPELETLELAVDIDGYQDWLPEGNFKDGSKLGNALAVTAKVQGTNGAPTTAKADWIRFQLVDISHEPGVCLNQPSKAVAKTDPDYKFETDKNPFPLLPISDAQVETLPARYSSAKAVISSFDFGGWCSLKVTALVDGQILTGYLTTDTQRSSPEIRIPRRQQNSHTADAWLEAQGATGTGDDNDDENTPLGDGHTGDGFTVYEEYRGFAQNGAILRTNPKKKDLMILNTIGGTGAAACQLFQKMSQIQVRHRFQPAEFSSGATEDNWLNFNHSTHHAVDQHGLRMVLDPAARGFAAAYNNQGFGGNSTPGSKSKIAVPPDLTAAAAGDRSGRGSLARYIAASYAHEIAHGCSLYHHGEVDPGGVTWTASDGADGVEWAEDGATIFPKTENGLAIAPLVGMDSAGNPIYQPVKGYVGEQQGQHSGDTKCAMRYDCAVAYIYPAGSPDRYLGGNEVTGTAFCTSGTGTGVNAPGRSPRPRFGDAATGRGNCKGQLCVNDKYVSDAKHNR